jgi:hypothetical protein
MAEGTLRIGLVHCSHGEDYYHVDIVDNKSGIRVAEVRLTLEQFAMALGSRVISDVEVHYGALEKVGLKHENKTEQVDLGPHVATLWDNFQEALEKAVKPFEVDCWIARRDERFNGHRYKDGKYTVHFHRWVSDSEVDE